MKIFKDQSSLENTIPLTYLWWIPAIIPLAIIYYNFITSYWTWGLMDDYRMILYPGDVWGRFNTMYQSLSAQGRFFPTFILHLAFFYKVFVNNPLAFFFFRFIEVLMALGIWAYLAYKVTGQKLAFPLFLAVTMPFIRFFDAFYFLSTQEILGVLFSGAAAICFWNGIQKEIKEKAGVKFWPLVAGVIFLLLAYTSKEPFVSFGVALGLTFIGVWLKDRQLKKVLVLGVLLLLFSIAYAACLKIFVAKAYTASYSVGSEQLFKNISIWFRFIFKEHLPWLIIMLGFVVIPVAQKQKFSIVRFSGILLGFFSYVCYLGIILPWNASGHYVMPFAPFFAFMVTVVIAPKMSVLKPIFIGILIVFSSLLNLHVGGKAIYQHTIEQYDKGNLLIWMAQNSIFQHEVITQGKTVRCNVQEPCSALISLSKTLYDVSFPAFKISPKISEILRDANTRYYIWQTSAGDQDLRRLAPMWTPVFVSKSWIVFRRMF